MDLAVFHLSFSLAFSSPDPMALSAGSLAGDPPPQSAHEGAGPLARSPSQERPATTERPLSGPQSGGGARCAAVPFRSSLLEAEEQELARCWSHFVGIYRQS